MAKMKIYELAKEIDKSNKEILTFLAEKGIEAKSHMSTIEEETVEMVKKAFSAKEEPKKEEIKEAGKENEPKAEPPKKKKSIIFVSNPHNSKMPGARTQGGGQRPQKNRPGKPVEKEPNPFRPHVPKPVVKPVVIERSEPPASFGGARKSGQKQEEQSRNTYRQETVRPREQDEAMEMEKEAIIRAIRKITIIAGTVHLIEAAISLIIIMREAAGQMEGRRLTTKNLSLRSRLLTVRLRSRKSAGMKKSADRDRNGISAAKRI